MSIRMNQLPLDKQMKISLLSKKDQEKIINSPSVEIALKELEELEGKIKLNDGLYEPTLQVSGSLKKYKTKNLFTERFEKQDLLDFMTLAEMTANMEDEVIQGELLRKIDSMHRQNKSPLQCMIYATKYNEKIFYNNEKKMTLWAQTIAQTVNNTFEYTNSINHMLVNWSMWKYQITMLITACKYIKKNNQLDEVIRDLYSNSTDDKIRFTVLKRLLYSFNEENCKKAFIILKNSDFINSDPDKKYFNLLRKTVEAATDEERSKLFKCFRSITGFTTPKINRIESLFIEKPTSEGIAQKINNALPTQKDEIINWVHRKIWGPYKEWRDIVYDARNIKQYRKEIQEMFIEKLDRKNPNLDELKNYSIAIGELDTDGNGFSFLEERLNYYNDDEKQLIIAYALAILSDRYIELFINYILQYDGFNAETIIPKIKNLKGPTKKQLVRQHLYSSCIKIKDTHKLDSRYFKVALKNLAIFLHGKYPGNIYDIKFDQLLFDFIGYNKIDFTFETKKCTTENTKLVLDILDTVMDRSNYEGRYMQFVGDLFTYMKDKNNELASKIDRLVKTLTGQGIPSK